MNIQRCLALYLHLCSGDFRLNLFTAKDITIDVCAAGKQVLVIDRMRSQSSHFYNVSRMVAI